MKAFPDAFLHCAFFDTQASRPAFQSAPRAEQGAPDQVVGSATFPATQRAPLKEIGFCCPGVFFWGFHSKDGPRSTASTPR